MTPSPFKTSIERRSRIGQIIAWAKRQSPRQILTYLSAPAVGLVVFSFATAIRPTKFAEPIERNREVLLAEYADPMFDLLTLLKIDSRIDRGNLDAYTNQEAAQHLQKHSALLGELMSSYERDFLASVEVPRLIGAARKEIAEGYKDGKPHDRLGDINFQTCLDKGVNQTDCVLVRYAGDGLTLIRQGHEEKNVEKFDQGRRLYLSSLLALGDYSPREPDLLAAITTASTYRKSVYQSLFSNRMWLGNGADVVPLPVMPLEGAAVSRRIQKSQGGE